MPPSGMPWQDVTKRLENGLITPPCNCQTEHGDQTDLCNFLT